MHHHGFHADGAQERHVCGEGGLELIVDHGIAAVLHYHDLIVEMLEPRQRFHQNLCTFLRGHIPHYDRFFP